MYDCGCGIANHALGYLTETEALAIVREELEKDSVKIAAELIQGKYDTAAGAVKRAVERICVVGAKTQATDVLKNYGWLMTIIGSGAIFYFLKLPFWYAFALGAGVLVLLLQGMDAFPFNNPAKR